MLSSLSVRNYALILSLQVDFSSGLSTITGETGAGKSILMGALGLILGDRADSSVLNDKNKKCVVEAAFNLKGLGLKELFEKADIDYEDNSIIRRELLPGGKSRAFINDTPVTLPILKELGEKLVNIHAQHHNLMVKEEGFPLEVVDAFMGLTEEKNQFKKIFYDYSDLKIRVENLRNRLSEAQKEQDYLEFQFGQLEEVKLQTGEEEELEREQEMLNHTEDIQSSLDLVDHSFNSEETNILGLIKKSIQEINSVKQYYTDLEEPSARLESAYLELKDLAGEFERLHQGLDHDPERLSIVNDRLDLLYSLFRKHMVNSSEELINIREQISDKLLSITSSDTELNSLLQEEAEKLKMLDNKANNLRGARVKGLQNLSKSVVNHLKEIGIPNARFEVRHSALPDFNENGRDKFSFYFSANQNQELELVQKVASGGEISRLMLSIKALISNSLDVPTLIFDEIDAGVSGEVADKMGKMLKEISKSRQVINVTHLPQVAGRGDHHYHVYKYDKDKVSQTDIRLLDHDGRINEMAKMLSGERLSEEAINNARALLHQS